MTLHRLSKLDWPTVLPAIFILDLVLCVGCETGHSRAAFPERQRELSLDAADANATERPPITRVAGICVVGETAPDAIDTTSWGKVQRLFE